jgi:hypothetical protein
LIVTRRPTAVAAALRALIGQFADRWPDAQIPALWTLDGLGELTEIDLVAYLRRPFTGRNFAEAALLIAASRVATSPRLQDQVIRHLRHPDEATRFQAALLAGPSGQGSR